VICGTCGTENEPDAKFCTECGNLMQPGCSNCGVANKPGAKFCRECGTTLSTRAGASTGAITGPPGLPEGSPVGPPAPVAERRLVSVLFADLVGFTPFAEERDAEQVRDTLSRYFDLTSEVIGRYGGTVEKFIGDAVMAVWGAPTAHEDDAERAVRAALEVVDAVRALGPEIQARVGVLTGEAAVTIGATNQGMVAGDLVNTAARLQSVAPPGAVLVGEATHRAASQAIAFEEAGEQLLKGKAAPVPAWRAVRVVAELGGRNRADTLEAPFVGRDEEFRLLKDSFHASGREKRARLVSIIGPAGIGKSRLAWEFSKYTDGLVETTYWHVGRSPAYGDGITFWALGEMVRRRVGLAETADEATTRAKVAQTVAAWVPDESERRWIEESLLVLLGLERGPGSEQLFGAWRTFFERLAADGTVTLVFEDLHWADPGTLDFIDHLLEWSKNVPIYVVTLARPELLEKRPDWGAGKRSFISLYLEPLPETAMRGLLAGLVPGLPEAAARAIVARADGIPLYAVETVRMLLADAKLRLEGEVYVPVGDLTDLAVPETLTALIAARLDGLDPADRTLLSDAAVLGQSFTTEGLAAVSGESLAELEPRIRALARRELLTLNADPHSPERGQYAFVQALIREVAYNTLARADRKTKHLAAARFFESLGSDELAGALAGHYLAAHSYATKGPEADALAGQARIALRAAADRASALGSREQATHFYEQALSVSTEPAEQASLLERAGDEASVAGRHEAAQRHLRRGIEIYRELADRTATARTTASLGRILISARQADVAETLLEQAATEFADLPPGPERAAIGGQLARAAWLNGNPRRAIEVADPALDMAEHLNLIAIVADTFVTKGGALAGSGRILEGLALMRAGQEVAERHGLVEATIRAYGNQPQYQVLVDPAAALETGRAGLAVARRLGAVNPVIVGNLITAALRVGEWAEARHALDDALAANLEPSDRQELLLWDAVLDAYVGEPTDATMAEIEAMTAGTTDKYRQLGVRWTRGFIGFAGGRLKEAHRDWQVAIEESESGSDIPLLGRLSLWDRDPAEARKDLAALDAAGVHGPPLEADRTTIRAGIAALEGRGSEALALYRQALRAWRDLGLAWDEALCGMDMALLLDPAEPEVRTAAQSTREILVRLGARPFIERLDAALAQRAAEPAAEAPTAPVETAAIKA
jgi:class 3 adenylate cyclase/tetratricopeptide (TPR) repeat protein/ribosomal protein L40E